MVSKLSYLDPTTQQMKEVSTVAAYGGSGNAGKPVVLDGTGKIADSLVNSSGGGGPVTYDRRVDDTDPDQIYVGDADPGALENAAVWRIFRADFANNSVTKNYADGVATFVKTWDDRATYTY